MDERGGTEGVRGGVEGYGGGGWREEGGCRPGRAETGIPGRFGKGPAYTEGGAWAIGCFDTRAGKYARRCWVDTKVPFGGRACCESTGAVETAALAVESYGIVVIVLLLALDYFLHSSLPTFYSVEPPHHDSSRSSAGTANAECHSSNTVASNGHDGPNPYPGRLNTTRGCAVVG